MKVALVDNMNNNFFALARYFRDLGAEVDLYLIPGRNHTHFDPQADTWQDVGGMSWIKDFPMSYHPINYLKPARSTLYKMFAGYDKIIACGASLGLFYRGGISVDMFIPYGSDLINLPFFTFELSCSFTSLSRSALLKFISVAQRHGIQRSKKIAVNTNWHLANQALAKMSLTAINIPRVMVYKEHMPAKYNIKYSWLSSYDFSIFSPTRHEWATNSEPMPDFLQNGGAKRNDKLIRAFAQLVEAKLVSSPLLLMCEYGFDVDYSKKMVASLGIQRFVKWLPLLPRKEILIIMQHVSVIADQFREGMSATSAGTTNEALAVGKPIITNSDGACKDVSDPYYKCPILEALSIEEIYFWLERCAKSPLFAKSVGDAGAKWFDVNLGSGLAQKYLTLLHD